MLAYSLCKKLGINNIPYIPTNNLGGGADGDVYEIENDPDKVIKFCVNYEYPGNDLENYYHKVDKILSSLEESNNKVFAKVYCHDFLEFSTRDTVSGPQKFVVYYYVMEKLLKISEDEKRVLHVIMSHEDNNKIKNYSNLKIKEMLKGMATALDFDDKKIMFFYTSYHRNSIVQNDLHVRNIMKNNLGDFKIIDFDRCNFNQMENING